MRNLNCRVSPAMAHTGCRVPTRSCVDGIGCRYLDQLFADDDGDACHDSLPGTGRAQGTGLASSNGCRDSVPTSRPAAAASGPARAYAIALLESALRRKARGRSRSPRAAFAMEWEYALRMRPATEPWGPSLVDALAPLCDMPLVESCRILFEYQGRVTFYRDLPLQTFAKSEVDRWRRARPGGVRQAQRELCDGGRGQRSGSTGGGGSGSCHVPSLAEAKVYPVVAGALRRRRFREPEIQ